MITEAITKPFEQSRKDRVEDHQRLFRRCRLDLGGREATDRPTDQRVAAAADEADPALAALYFQFARYLLITSSRPG